MTQTAKEENTLKEDMLKHVPDQLWSKHETDVGLVMSANTKIPRKAKYPLNPEAEQGICRTIEGLIDTGVWVETQSYCNTPILPVLKADKSKILASS